MKASVAYFHRHRECCFLALFFRSCMLLCYPSVCFSQELDKAWWPREGKHEAPGWNDRYVTPVTRQSPAYESTEPTGTCGFANSNSSGLVTTHSCVVSINTLAMLQLLHFSGSFMNSAQHVAVLVGGASSTERRSAGGPVLDCGLSACQQLSLQCMQLQRAAYWQSCWRQGTNAHRQRR